MLFYDSLDQFSDYMVQVKNTKTGEVIKGLIDNDDLSYSMGANLGGSQMAGMAEGGLKGLAKSFAGKVAGDVGKSMIDNNFKTVLSTYKGYEDSSETSFPISMHLFPNKSGNGSYPDMIEIIAKLTQPNTEDSKFLQSYLYDPNDTKSLALGSDPFKGQLIHVSIGDWFLATGLFCTSSNPKMTKFVDTDGKPLYAEWDATFTPYKILNAGEISSWHLK